MVLEIRVTPIICIEAREEGRMLIDVTQAGGGLVLLAGDVDVPFSRLHEGSTTVDVNEVGFIEDSFNETQSMRSECGVLKNKFTHAAPFVRNVEFVEDGRTDGIWVVSSASSKEKATTNFDGVINYVVGESKKPSGNVNEAKATLAVAYTLVYSLELQGKEGGLKGRFVREMICALAEGLVVHQNLEIGIINIYGPNAYRDRVSFFEQLNNIIEILKVPVIVGGDFNIVRSDLERIWNHDISSSILLFEEFISKWDLVDVLISGSIFTWFRGGVSTVVSRLKRKPKKVCKPFKWFDHWADDPSLADKIRRVFGANQGKYLNHVLLLTKKATKEWNPSDKATQAELVSVKAKLWAEYRKAEREWLQKSRLKRFREEDKNTKFYHLTAAIRGHRNQISKLKVNGSVFKNQAWIQINSASRRLIESPFSKEEVWLTINSSDCSRAPGPDGFNLDFFKKFWKDIKGNVMKGLRQGFPLSPFLFNIVGKALSRLLKKTTALDVYRGVHIGVSKVDVFHIQFANDLILFSDAKEDKILNLFRVLRIFEIRCCTIGQGCLQRIWGCRWVIKNLKLMRLPIVEKVRSRLQSWKARFQWNVKSDRGIHWIKWDMVNGLKSHGGLGFFDVKVRNRILLNKWIWRFSEDNDSLWKKIIVAKYMYDPEVILPKGISARRLNGLWYEIVHPLLSNEDEFLVDVRCVMGNGSRIDFWTDVRSLKVDFPRIYGMAIKKQGKISEFGSWANGGVSSFPGLDRLMWLGDSNGIYKSKEFCIKSASVGIIQDPIWNKVWNKFVPPKVVAFVWKTVYNRLSVATELTKRGVNSSVQLIYLFCKDQPEDVIHVLCHCIVVWKV
ncbi:hypothetical protein F3Y22_tig00110940pilonHSYRG00486 [Hibiscus syriacus]|uniref:Reverse transcriptase zinc-binding domain-containing protein n=1 Tax=Hibiscus syriacus TaxID=106335 RepID=A0A6A2ZD32_HIBSY|nr:hypothetical protein F3Y22_tig00110940pilonHSYRG00486 [Hibiscus syriacus]